MNALDITILTLQDRADRFAMLGENTTAEALREVLEVAIQAKATVIKSPYECYWRDRAFRAEKDLNTTLNLPIHFNLDETVRFILGRPSFILAPIAHRLKLLGCEIKSKCEDEQAFVIHWLLHLYFTHGKDGWEPEMTRLLRQVPADVLEKVQP